MSSDDEPTYMSGAVLAPCHKDKPPAITVPLRERKHVREYFLRRRAGLPCKPAPMFAGDAPHTCTHCEATVLDLDQLRASSVVPLCDSLSTAIERATAECAFFEWLVEALMERELSSDSTALFQGDTCAEINFGIRLSPWKRGMPMRVCIWADFIEPDGEFRSKQLEGSELNVYANEGYIKTKLTSLLFSIDDLAALYIPSRPHEPDKGSRKSISFLRENLKDCLANHPKCRLALTDTVTSEAESILVEDLPTRLLHFDTGGLFIRLVTVPQLSIAAKARISQRGYASLSYCWGGPQPFCLTKKTMQTLTQGIEVSILPNTLRDAITALSSLGLEYIWIDALNSKFPECPCIMAITRLIDDTFVAGPFRISLATVGGLGSVQLSRYTSPPPEPIASRGWTFQESLLSRRLVIYGTREVYWTCNTMTGTYGGPNAMSESRYSTVDRQLLGTTRNLINILEYPWEFAWSDVVTQFMTRRLGVESDKLLAIAALASRMADEAEKRGTSLIYIAGLFVCPKSIISWAAALLWRVDSPEGTKRAGTYRAPSWSWACVDGAWGGGLGIFSPLPFDLKKYEFDFQVTDFVVEPRHPSALFGSIQSASLFVKGWVKRLDSSLEMMTKFSYPQIIIQAERDRTKSGLYVLGDTADDVELIQAVVKGQENELEVYILELIPPFFSRGKPSVGLILRGRIGESIVRIGVYVLYAKAEFLETFFDSLAEDILLV
ncbi:hypothetical protein F5X97DRAFT_331098 [Nemania serpens]|nr:hypothetical protein F5X97DRAFT_331098 [Nemania serpens]